MSLLYFFKSLWRFFTSWLRKGRPVSTTSVAPSEGPVVRPAMPAPTAHLPLTRMPVLRGPVVTEKATLRATHQEYAFRVGPGASKLAVRAAIERTYGVHVLGVRVMNVPGKLRRRGRILGAVSGYRKAVVTIREGERIDVSPGAPVD